MKRVILVCMPFASVSSPSLALSLLKPLVEEESIPCDIAYLNVAFRAYVKQADLYDKLADHGSEKNDWLFGEALFGSEWSRCGTAWRKPPETLPLPDDLDFLHAMQGDVTSWCLSELQPAAAPFLQACMQDVRWADYGIIGFTSSCGQNVASLSLARHIKERWPERIIAIGGPNCDDEMGIALLRLFPFVDWAFSGEADLSFPQAVRQWCSGRPPEGIPGVAFRRDGEIIDQGSGRSIDLDALPYPDFGDYHAALQRWAQDRAASSFLPIELSRGCWWKERSQCIFCGVNRGMQRFRCKSLRRAKAEINTLHRRYGHRRLSLTDANANMELLEALLPDLADQGKLDGLSVVTKVGLNRKQLALLRDVGVKEIQTGIESLDSEMLAYMRKGTTLLENVQFLKWAKEYGLVPLWNLLYGFPGEDPLSYARMASFIPSLTHLPPPYNVRPVELHRFSPLFEQSEAWRIRNVRAPEFYRSIYPFSDADLVALAYCFEFDFDGKADIPSRFAPLRRELKSWQAGWGQSEPPLLTVERCGEEHLVIHDTRPSRSSLKLELNNELAIAYLACDARQRFDCLTAEMRQRFGTAYSGDAALRQGLDELVAQRIMLRDGDWYLSLAIDVCRQDLRGTLSVDG